MQYNTRIEGGGGRPWASLLRVLRYLFFVTLGVIALDWHRWSPYLAHVGSVLLRHASRPQKVFATQANCSLFLFANIPPHGIGNKLSILGATYVLATSSKRCLAATFPQNEMFEDMGLMTVKELPAFFLNPNVPADVLPLNEGNVTAADGHDCAKVCTNCHPFAEGAVDDAFLSSPFNISIGGYMALKPSTMTLMDFDARMTSFLQHLDVASHYSSTVADVWRRCKQESRSGIVIGVHFRRGDSCRDANKMALSDGVCAPISQIITATIRVLHDHEGAAVFFASDDPFAHIAFREALPDIPIVTSEWTIAAIDLKLLSMTHFIVGSKFSTFSYVAARWGGVAMIESG
jgi:hypothetical protein